MKIDSHQHFWIYDSVRDTWIDESMGEIQRDFLPEDLLPILNENQIDGCIAVQADQSEAETEFLIDLANRYSFIKAVVGWVDLCADNAESRLRHYSHEPHFKGVRHILQAEDNAFLLRDDFQNGVALLEPLQLVYEILIHHGQLENAIQLVDQFPSQQFVLDHVAKPDIKNKSIEPWKTQVTELARYENVACKISGMVTEADWNNHRQEDFAPYLDIVFEVFGVDRVLFGSDWPVCLVAASYREILALVVTYIASLSKNEHEKIMGQNAVRLYGL